MKRCVFIHWTNGEEWRTFRTHKDMSRQDDLSMVGGL
jgi:hypothetical protein